MPDEVYCEIQIGGPRAKRRGIAFVDRADAEVVGVYSWSMHSNGYAMRSTQVGGKRHTVFLHRELLGLGPGDPQIDHINGNTLDNRRDNLRPATHAQNGQNRQHRPEYPHRGTTWDAQNNRWRARAQLAGKTHNLGLFPSQAEAAAVAAAFRREHMPYSLDAREAREVAKAPQITLKNPSA
jgi:hypothetical protein